MYNTAKINKIKEQIQAEIDAVIEKYEPIMNAAIKAQIPKTNSLYYGMGSTFCQNRDGEYVGEKFVQEIHMLPYKDSFRTGMNIENVNVK